MSLFPIPHAVEYAPNPNGKKFAVEDYSNGGQVQWLVDPDYDDSTYYNHRSFLDPLGGANLLRKRNLDSIGGGNLVRRAAPDSPPRYQSSFLDPLGGGNLLRKRNLDSIGGGNLLRKRNLDSIGGGNLVRRSPVPLRTYYLH